MFTIDDSYLEDEVRDGFYIPSISKRAFAAELSLLHELNRICEKYNLKYFADWGSLLGAIRHRGFIPWDDDLDVCMHRNDLEKLLEVEKNELPDGFSIQSFENNDFSWKFIYNLVNTEKMNFSPEYLKSHFNFPYMATIDIFVLDNLSDDEEYEEKRRADVKFILDVADLTTDENIKKPEYLKALDTVEKLRNVRINRSLTAIEIKRILFKAVQDILKEQNNKETEYIVQMIPWGIYHDRKIHKSYYEKSVNVPFENTYISVPLKYYGLFLNHKYGRFWEIKMGVSGHGYPYFKLQREALGTDMDYIPHYKFDETELIKDKSARKSSIKAIAEEYSEYLKISYNDILQNIQKMTDGGAQSGNQNAENIGSENAEKPAIIDQLTVCQENAIQFGTLVEKVKGENTDTVKNLEKYCEYLFEISQHFFSDSSNNTNSIHSGEINDLVYITLPTLIKTDFKTCTDSILASIKTEIIDRRNVLFLPYKSTYFESLRPYYDMESQKTDTDVYVVPLPYYYKEYNGKFKENAQFDLSGYPDDIKTLDYNTIDIGLIYLDTIYIQNPYDEYNMCYSVPDYFYSSNLKNLTDELIYVPWFETSDFDADNYPQNYNMQYYCTVPGVVLSDTVYVSSETIRSRYIEKLTEFSGDKYKNIWEEKIKIAPFNKKHAENADNHENAINPAIKAINNKNPIKKYLCFYTSPSYILEKGGEYFEKLRRCLDIFSEAGDNINVIWHIEPYELEMIEKNDAQIYAEFTEILNKAAKTGNIIIDHETNEAELTEKCAAYYGDGSFLSKDFVISGKPVMIMDINIL